MTQKAITDEIMPSATPSADEIRRWRSLPRDEQVARMKSALDKAINGPRSDASMDDIKAAAEAEIAALSRA